MGEVTTISWTDHTFNPWWGCTKIEGPGDSGSACDHCYAERDSKRYGFQVWGKDAERRFLSDHHWRQPLRWERQAIEDGRPHLVFCASMCDVFEHRVPDDLGASRQRLWELIEQTPHLIWQLLTKRPEWIRMMVPRPWLEPGGWPEHVWAGTTIEDEQRARIRLPRLLRVPAPVRFISGEPLLGDIALWPWLSTPEQRPEWIIVGGESGAGWRPLDLDVARRVRDDCAEAGVPFFFKQTSGYRSGTPGPPDLAIRQFPAQARRG